MPRHEKTLSRRDTGRSIVLCRFPTFSAADESSCGKLEQNVDHGGGKKRFPCRPKSFLMKTPPANYFCALQCLTRTGSDLIR